VGGKSNQLVEQLVKVARHLEQCVHGVMLHLVPGLLKVTPRYMDVAGLQQHHRKRLLQQLCPDT
jgi:hypothetical protein